MGLRQRARDLRGDRLTSAARAYCFKFICDEKHAYLSGPIRGQDVREAVRVLKQHFPGVEVSGFEAPDLSSNRIM